MSSTRRGGTCFRARQRRQRLLEAVCSGFRSYQFECGDDTAKDGLADPTSFYPVAAGRKLRRPTGTCGSTRTTTSPCAEEARVTKQAA